MNIPQRIATMVGIARIAMTRVDRGKGRYTMTAQTVDPITTEVRDDTPIMTAYGFSSRPKPGADAVVVYVAGNRGNGVVIATSDGRFSVELAPGEVVMHADDGTKIHLQTGGKIAITSAGGIAITSPKITLTGDLEVAGDVKAGTVSLKHHRHQETGAGGGTTMEPMQ